jgi:hypothetical protein
MPTSTRILALHEQRFNCEKDYAFLIGGLSESVLHLETFDHTHQSRTLSETHGKTRKTRRGYVVTPSYIQPDQYNLAT